MRLWIRLGERRAGVLSLKWILILEIILLSEMDHMRKRVYEVGIYICINEWEYYEAIYFIQKT